jgi:hypothetical protein
MNNLLFSHIVKTFNIGLKLKNSCYKLGNIFYEEIINKFINNRFISFDNKILLKEYRNIISKK